VYAKLAVTWELPKMAMCHAQLVLLT